MKPLDETKFSDEQIHVDIDSGIILLRIDDKVHTNIRHLVVHHSPDGYEFGYAGSGPADLALNICEILLNRLGYHGERVKCFEEDCWDLAWKLHQDFKFQFLVKCSHDHYVLPYETAKAWVETRMDKQAPVMGNERAED